MNISYYLSTCDTCKRILKETNWSGDLVDIKKKNIDGKTLDYLHSKTGSYESLFNKRARKFKDPEVKARIQSDTDYRALILEEYTFLKRPVFIVDDQVFVGNSPKTIKSLKSIL